MSFGGFTHAPPNRGSEVDPYLSPEQDAIGHFPARLLTPDEHALLGEWLAAAGDIAEAYVSNRRGDDPGYYRRIVITTTPGDGPSHFVHASLASGKWVVLVRGPNPLVDVFPTLRAALNAVRSVLPEIGAEADRSKPEV